jgi:hypothetical protein
VGRPVSWEEQLFSLLDDLERQAEAAFDAERDLDLADRSRAEYSQVTLASRLMASVDQEVVLEVLGVGRIQGALQRVGSGWCLLRGPGQDWIVRSEALVAVHDASPRSVPEVAWSPVTRLGLGSALRRLANSGDRCLFHLVEGSRHELVVTRVGQDFVEGRSVDGRLVLMAFPALAAVQSTE